MANTKVKSIEKWKNFHSNGPLKDGFFPANLLLETQLEKPQILPAALDRYRDAAQEVQRLIQEALDKQEGFRAIGSKWSLSGIPHHQERMHVNQKMNLKIAIEPEDLHPASTFQNKNLFLFQCGNVIKEISEHLFKLGKSLKTTGASNGQTIAGAISTGVHGSTIDFGSVQDYVVGLNLIIGPGPEDVVYLERASQPALHDAFATKINARVLRNDDLFNAAVVGLGSFGFIHGVVIEVEDVFLLQRYVKKLDQDTALGLADSLDFQSLNVEIPEERDLNGLGARPFHYKIFVNPYQDDGHYVVEIWYKKPYHEPYPSPAPIVKKAIYLDLLTCLSKLIRNHSKSIPRLITALQRDIFPEPDESLLGTLKDLCWDVIQTGPAFACSVGIDHSNTSRAIRLLVDLAKKAGPIPGIFGLRFVKASKATLAFTKFPITCILEIDGGLWKGSKRLISPEKFYHLFIKTLIDNAITFTLHWGKNAAWDFPGLVEHMYGEDAPKSWRTYRSALLSREMAQVFSNDFLKTIGLSEYVDLVPQDLLA